MNLGISGRNAIVNGGSAGLGFGTALALATEGANLFISARNKERLHNACERIRRETGARVEGIATDHATPEGRSRILERCPEPDIVVGTCSPPPYVEDFRSISANDWHSNLDTTLISPVEFMRCVVDGMIERRWGRIVNITTVAAKYPNLGRILSGAPRSALANYCVALARVVVQHNVTINMLLPAVHDTDGIRAVYAAKARANGTSLEAEIEETVRSIPIPAGRFGSATDFGVVAAMFCSEQANYITGQSLVVDGGALNSLF